MQKCDGSVPHTGGKRFAADSEYYQTMLRWLEAGVPNDPADVATVTGLEIYPPKAVLEGKDTTQQFIARAKYSDGTDRDVTNLARVPDEQRQLGPDQRRRPGDGGGPRRGVRHGPLRHVHRRQPGAGAAQGSCNTRRPRRRRPTTSTSWSTPSCRSIRVLPSELCSDEVFLRRVTIDITGLLPTVEEYQAFVADSRPGQAGQAGRPAARAQGVFRNLGPEVGQPADGQDARTRSATSRCSCTRTG